MQRRYLLKFIAVTDDKMDVNTLVATLKSIEPFIHRVILREKSKTEEELLELYAQLKNKKFSSEKLIVHSNPQIAQQVNIHKVHLRSDQTDIATLQNQFPSLLFGQSVHSLKGAKRAQAQGASYLVYGHIFDSTCKPGLKPRGLSTLKEMTKAVTIPVYAIGGILPAHIELLGNNDIAGFAVRSAIFEANDPAATAYEYVHKMKKIRRQHFT